MITSFLMGGIGNQMFQIAAATALAISNNDKAVFDFTKCHTPGQGNVSIKYKDNIFKNITHITDLKYDYIFEEMTPNIYKKIPYQHNMLIKGYFQNICYFKEYIQIIQDLFYINPDHILYIQKQLPEIDNFNSVTSVHIRRGDYLKLPDIFPLCTKEYYNKAMNSLQNQKFVFISDDIEWVKQNYTGKNIFYSELKDEILDLTLMTMCKNNIIANSSFSWWGAFLNKNKNKQVFAPPYWI